MQAKELITLMEEKYPLSLQEAWDRSGLQCGDSYKEIHKVMIALDCDQRTIEEAIAAKCDMLITHHPFLFKDLSLDLNSYVGKCISLAIKNDLVIYSSHTPLDKVSMNTWLCEALGLTEITDFEESGIAKKGTFTTPLTFEDFIARVKAAYHLPVVHVAGEKAMISRVAICGGSGSDFIHEADVDAYITGDLKYHTGEEATIQNKVFVDIGHHAEVIMVSHLKAELEKCTDLTIVESCSPDYYRYL